MRWLAAQIRASHLLDRHGWTWEDLADLIHGRPEHTNLPRHVANPRGWIRARLTRATPTLPPSKLRVVLHVERHSDLFRQRREADVDAAHRAAVAATRAAITACGLCDDLGWLHVDRYTPTVRCSHDPDSGRMVTRPPGTSDTRLPLRDSPRLVQRAPYASLACCSTVHLSSAGRALHTAQRPTAARSLWNDGGTTVLRRHENDSEGGPGLPTQRARRWVR